MSYKMQKNDIYGFAASVGNFYPMFVGTPAADIMYEVNSVLHEKFRVTMLDDSFDYDEVEGDEVFNPIVHKDAGTARDQITDSGFRESGIDENIRSLVSRLKKEIESDRYAENSIERAMLDYTLWGMQRIGRRDFVFSAPTRQDSKFWPGANVMSKFANYGFTPKLSEAEKAGMPRDNGDNFFSPNADQARAKYTKQELQESADSLGFNNIYKAGYRYVDALTALQDTVSIKAPDTQERQDILRNKLLGEIVNQKNEILKAFYKDPTDPVNLRMFDGKENQMIDSVQSNGRGYMGDLQGINRLERYLKSGLPVMGYAEFYDLQKNAASLYETAKTFEDVLDNNGDFLEAAKKLSEKMENLPGENATEAERNAYLSEASELMTSCRDAYKNLMEHPQFKEPNQDMKLYHRNLIQDLRAEFQAHTQQDSRRGKDLASLAADAEAIKHLGESSIRELGESRKEYLQSLENDRITIGAELKRFRAAHGKHYSQELNGMLDNIAAYCEPDSAVSMEWLSDKLGKLKKRADAEYKALMQGTEKDKIEAGNHFQRLTEWTHANKGYIDNKISGARVRGILTDETVNKQMLVQKRNGVTKLDAALESFNTRRSRIFGKGEVEGIGKETEIHKNTRKAAEDLMEARRKLLAVDHSAEPEKWTALAEDAMKKAKKLSELSVQYMNDKNHSAGSGAGKKRLEGASKLFREAEIMRVMLRQEMALDQRYERFKEDTIHPAPVDENALREEAARVKAERVKAERERVANGIIPDQNAGNQAGMDQNAGNQAGPDQNAANRNPNPAENHAGDGREVNNKGLVELMKEEFKDEPGNARENGRKSHAEAQKKKLEGAPEHKGDLAKKPNGRASLA